MNRSPELLIVWGLALILGIWLISMIWPYLLGGLAIWGGFMLVREYQQGKRHSQNNERRHHHGPRYRN